MIDVKGYLWFGQNRRSLHRKAVRGSGGVGLLIRKEVLEGWEVEVLDTDVEDVMWRRLSQEDEEDLVMAVCYLPPEASSRGPGVEETFQLLPEQVAKFRSLGQVIICGDFNARCEKLDMDIEGIPPQKVIDSVKNSQGEVFADFVRGMNMVVVNGRKGRGAFTCISGRRAQWLTIVWLGRKALTSSITLEC